MTIIVTDLRPTRHKIGPLGDVLPSQSLKLSTKKLKQTQQKQPCIHKEIYSNIKLEDKKLQPGLVTSYTSGLETEWV